MHFCQELKIAPRLAMVLVVLPSILIGCTRRNASPAVPKKISAPTVTGFVDVTQEAGIDFRMGFLPNEQGETFKINLYDHGCGVAVGDYDGDGDDDIYLLNQLGPNGLFRNHGDGTFQNVTDEVGVALKDRICVGATFSDYDNDGDQDLFVTSTRGGNALFRNEGQGRFTEWTKEAGLEHLGHSQTAAFFDYDNDGWLDLYLVQTAQWTKEIYDDAARYYVGKGELGSFGQVLASPAEYNILYRNNQHGGFTNVTAESGLKGRGWAGDIAVLDYDEDGWLDVLVTCMFGRAQLYRNQANGTFQDVTLDTLGKTPFGGIGARVFDFNNDGKLDIYIVDMHSDMWMGIDFKHTSEQLAKDHQKKKFDYFFGPYFDQDAQFRTEEYRVQDVLGFERDEVLFGNAFYLNLGESKFKECSTQLDLETFWPWGIAAADFDNNGFVDIFLPSGMGYPFYFWPNSLLMNESGKLFSDKAAAYGVELPRAGKFLDEKLGGQECARSSRCAATADFDGDGRLEIIVNNFNHEPYLYKNRFPTQHFVSFKLTGTRSNRDAIGALVTLIDGTTRMVRQVESAGGYLSQSSKTVHFGIGARTKIEKVEIRWPSGRRQTLEGIEVDKVHETREE